MIPNVIANLIILDSISLSDLLLAYKKIEKLNLDARYKTIVLEQINYAADLVKYKVDHLKAGESAKKVIRKAIKVC